MSQEYNEIRNKLFEEFGWEYNAFTEKLFEAAWDQGHAYGENEVRGCMYDMDEILWVAESHYKGKYLD